MRNTNYRPAETVLIAIIFRLLALIWELIMLITLLIYAIPMLLFRSLRESNIDHFMIEYRDYHYRTKNRNKDAN